MGMMEILSTLLRKFKSLLRSSTLSDHLDLPVTPRCGLCDDDSHPKRYHEGIGDWFCEEECYACIFAGE
jgi:hypothetical protein